MPNLESLTVTLPVEMAAEVKDAVAAGQYASASELVRAALRDWRIRAEGRQGKLDALRREIDEGLADFEAGPLVDADLDDIIEEGRLLSGRRDQSA